MAGSCSLNNYIDRDIDHLMERTKRQTNCNGKMNPSKVAIMGFLFIVIGTILFDY